MAEEWQNTVEPMTAVHTSPRLDKTEARLQEIEDRLTRLETILRQVLGVEP